MPSNPNITLQFLGFDTGPQAWVEYSIWSLIKVLYISKTTSVSFEIKFLTIQALILFTLNTIGKIWSSALNVSIQLTWIKRSKNNCKKIDAFV